MNNCDSKYNFIVTEAVKSLLLSVAQGSIEV